MATWKRLMFAVAGPLAVAWLLTLVSTPPAQTQGIRPPTPVQVTNTPLPVTGSVGISGTPDVNIANSPTVKVGNGAGEPIPVTGNVNATLGGPVQIAGTPTVNVGNPLLPVAPQADDPGAAYVDSLPGAFADSPDTNLILIFRNLPRRKMLVMETVTVEASAEAGQKVKAFLVARDPLGTPLYYHLSMTPHGNFSSAETYQGTHYLRARAWPSQASDLVLVFSRNSTTGRLVGSATLSGYLVDF